MHSIPQQPKWEFNWFFIHSAWNNKNLSLNQVKENTFYYDFLVSPWLVIIILAWNPIRYPSISYSLLFTFSANVHYSITSKMKSNLHFATWNMTWSIKIFFCTCAVFEQRNYITMSHEQSLIAFSLAMYSSTFCFPWNAFNVGWD